MLDVTIKLTGTSPLLSHNAKLSDPDDPVSQQIKAITSKRKKTEEDRHAIERLEWLGGLYTVDGIVGPAMPTGNIRKCLVEAGKINKLGKSVSRALAFHDLHVPINYKGPRDSEALLEDKAFANRASVKVGTSRVIRVRPQFPQWEIEAKASLLEDVMDFDELVRIVEQAGLAEGLGDFRSHGYGRFQGEVSRL